MDIEKVKNKTKEVIQKATENYFEGKDKIAYVILAWPGTDGMNGTFLLEMWPNSTDVELCYSPDVATIADLGTTVGTVSTEYFNLDCVASLIKIMYETYVG